MLKGLSAISSLKLLDNVNRTVVLVKLAVIRFDLVSCWSSMLHASSTMFPSFSTLLTVFLLFKRIL